MNGTSFRYFGFCFAFLMVFEVWARSGEPLQRESVNSDRLESTTVASARVLNDESQRAKSFEQYELIGSTRLRFLWFDIYRAELFSGNGQYLGLVPPLKLDLIYLRDISRKDLLQQTREQLSDEVEPELLQQWLATLSEVWPDVKEGQQLSFELLSKNKGRFYFEGKFLAELDSPGFAAAFINIWLNEKGPYARHARALKGRSS